MDAMKRATLFIVIMLLITRKPTEIAIFHFLRRRRRRRLMQAHLIQALGVFYMSLRANRRRLRQARRAWVFPQPQMWFQAIRRLNDDAVDFWYKENFRISKKTFDAICRIVGPATDTSARYNVNDARCCSC